MLDTLANILGKENRNWRRKTIVVIDGAPYHKTDEIKNFFLRFTDSYSVFKPVLFQAVSYRALI